MEALLTTIEHKKNQETYKLTPVRYDSIYTIPGTTQSERNVIPIVTQFPNKPFIEANTTEINLDHLKNNCVIPVFSKDNERTIAHQEFIEIAQESLSRVFLNTNFDKPEIEDVESISVFVSFVIEKDGSMTDIKVLKDPGYGLGKEAIRVLKSIRTKWSPGILDGKPVRTAYNLPITIQTN